MLVISSSAFSNTIIVDKNGGGQFTSIQIAVNNSSTNDTIKVWPGTYSEQLTLNKVITLIGSGYENTTIISSSNPTINMSMGVGKILHFKITCLNGDGIQLHNGTVSNCLITACSGLGIYAGTAGDNGLVQNCIINYNGSYGVETVDGGISVTNCIGRPNGGYYDFYRYNGTFNLSYSNGSHNNTLGNQGCIDVDPQFVSTSDNHISQGSPCWNTGNPALVDPDGSRSDMGYFCGPDCPIYPVVYEIIISPNGNNINLQAKGRANY